MPTLGATQQTQRAYGAFYGLCATDNRQSSPPLSERLGLASIWFHETLLLRRHSPTYDPFHIAPPCHAIKH